LFYDFGSDGDIEFWKEGIEKGFEDDVSWNTVGQKFI
jgi:hypothetical protein